MHHHVHGRKLKLEDMIECLDDSFKIQGFINVSCPFVGALEVKFGPPVLNYDPHGSLPGRCQRNWGSGAGWKCIGHHLHLSIYTDQKLPIFQNSCPHGGKTPPGEKQPGGRERRDQTPFLALALAMARRAFSAGSSG